MNLHHYLLSVTFCHLKAACSSLVVLSLGWSKGSRQDHRFSSYVLLFFYQAFSPTKNNKDDIIIIQWSIRYAHYTFKAHFITILAGVDDKLALSLWCHLLRPTQLTLNLLCHPCVTPKISAFAHVHGPHDYMWRPFSSLGCAVPMHVKPDNQLSWDTRSEPDFNLGTSMEHHWCFWAYTTRTWAIRVSDTVFFKHQYITNPTFSPE